MSECETEGECASRESYYSPSRILKVVYDKKQVKLFRGNATYRFALALSFRHATRATFLPEEGSISGFVLTKSHNHIKKNHYKKLFFLLSQLSNFALCIMHFAFASAFPFSIFLFPLRSRCARTLII